MWALGLNEDFNSFTLKEFWREKDGLARHAQVPVGFGKAANMKTVHPRMGEVSLSENCPQLSWLNHPG